MHRKIWGCSKSVKNFRNLPVEHTLVFHLTIQFWKYSENDGKVLKMSNIFKWINFVEMTYVSRMSEMLRKFWKLRIFENARNFGNILGMSKMENLRMCEMSHIY
uniref:Uncharacterized protein n=1 Tax=Photinus pyralis TaxID=7054 RepID=A0A1Y1KX51_PHOPY